MLQELLGQFIRVAAEVLEAFKLGFKFTGNFCIGRIIIDVVYFVRVFFQVVQFPGIDVIVEIQKLVLLGPHSVVAFGHVNSRVFIVVVV